MATIRHARTLLAAALLACCLSAPAAAQAYQTNTSQIPQGNPFNNSFSENVDFADIDLDGDLDAVWADGGDCCNDQNRLWVNMGGAQGGTLGFFQDRTSTQLPAVLNDSRDVDFVDVDDDGDQDLYVSNTSASGNQPNHWWINMGGLQGGTAGFFVDETAARWVNIAGPGSSVANSVKFGGGGFIDWSCDCSFADFDNDGDMDLMHTTYGGIFGGDVPSRVFLNDGAGFYEEFNPSGFKLSGTDIFDGNPALWCEGTHQHGTTNSNGGQADIADTPLGVELGDLDGDHDIDVLQGARNEVPRVYQNRFEENGGVLGFRDVTYGVLAQTANGGGNYEQELGDLDNDGDLDIYGLNWSSPGLSDIISHNDGSGNFSSFTILGGSSSDDNEGDFVDYDNDGNLDLFVSAFFSGDRIYKNSGPPSYSLQFMSGDLPFYSITALGADAADVDLDGDYDIMVGADGGTANVFLKNVTQVADSTAPRPLNLEQAPDRVAGPAPTVVRVDVFDNIPWYLTAFDVVVLKYQVNGGPVSSVPMKYSGGQSFRGELPGTLVGNVCYFVEARDEYSNTGVSGTLCFNASGGACTGNVSGFCTAKAGLTCGLPVITSSGLPSASATSGFTITASPARGGRLGVLMYNTQSGPPTAFQGGTLCVKLQGLRRGGPTDSLGTNGQCDGAFSIDMNTFAQGLWIVPPAGAIAANNPAPYLLVPGTDVYCQYWGRDSLATGSYVSDGLKYTVCP